MVDFKNLLVCLNNKENGKVFLQNCYEFAKKFNSHLEVLHVKPDAITAVPYMGNNFPVEIMKEMVELAEKENNKKLNELKSIFNDFSKEKEIFVCSSPKEVKQNKNSVSAFWNEKNGSETEISASIARFKGATLHPKPIENDEHSDIWTIDSVLTEGGSPILILPDKKIDKIGEHVGIYWSATAEVSRALKHSNQLISNAKKISIITPSEEQCLFEARGLVNSLLRQRLEANIIEFDNSSNNGETILDITEKENIDTLILGAYTNNHLRRLILGGVTKHIIYNANIPLFLSR